MSATTPVQRTLASALTPNAGGRPGVGGVVPMLFDPAGQWKRNPSWPALPAVTDTDERVVGLYAVFPGDGNFWAATCAGAWQVDYGDGATDTAASSGTLNKQFDYTDADLVGTDAPVTLNGTLDRVERVAHGYADGDAVSLFNIATTTGVVEAQTYYIVNADDDHFQVSATVGGSALALTGDGTATLLPYRIAVVDITPQSGQNLTSVNLAVKHNQAGLVNGYTSGWLDITISVPNATASGLVVGSTTVGPPRTRILERCTILTIGGCTSLAALFLDARRLRQVAIPNTAAVTNMAFMFNNCSSLTSVPLFNTASVTSTTIMFSGCASLTSVPLFNTAAVTTMASMFSGCSSLTSVPLFNTATVTTMVSMFSACSSLTSVPFFNTAAVTNMNSTFSGCASLTSVPLFNTAAVTNMLTMFSGCSSLTSVPLFNTAAVTTMASMFVGCASLTSVPLFSTAAVTNMSQMFNNCSSLTSVPLFNTAAVTNMLTMFGGCSSLTNVPALTTAAVSSSANFNNMFATCPSLQRMSATGFAFSFSLANCQLSGAQLDAIYTALPSVSGQTITVSGNFGTATHDPTIATTKGWTVTA